MRSVVGVLALSLLVACEPVPAPESDAGSIDTPDAVGHEDELRGIVESAHTNPPDTLAERLAAGAEVGTVEAFTGSTVIEEGEQRLELYEVQGIPHVSPKTLAYVPSARVLFQSDLFFGAPGADATALHAAVAERNLDVEIIVGGHGGALPFATLAEAVGNPQ